MTAELPDRDLQLIDRYLDGDLQGDALDALRARLVAEPRLRTGLQQRSELQRAVRASAETSFAPRAGFADRVLAASRRLPEPEVADGADLVRLCKSILLVAAAVFAAALLWQGAMSWGRGPESLQAAPDEAQRIVDDLDAKIRERDTGSGRK